MEGLTGIGAGVYFNTDVRIDGRRMKYGIVSEERFQSDLYNWDTLYLAGRCQKPVEFVLPKDEKISTSLKVNFLYALHAALLMLPGKFTRATLLLEIVGLSYLGDIRRGLAENPRKVMNIVDGQFDELWALYEGLLEEVGLGEFLTRLDQERFEQENGAELRNIRLMCLPSNLVKRIGYTEDFVVTPGKIKSAISSIISWPSAFQSAKGLLTANPSVSFNYLLSKIKKRFA